MLLVSCRWNIGLSPVCPVEIFSAVLGGSIRAAVQRITNPLGAQTTSYKSMFQSARSCGWHIKRLNPRARACDIYCA